MDAIYFSSFPLLYFSGTRSAARNLTGRWSTSDRPGIEGARFTGRFWRSSTAGRSGRGPAGHRHRVARCATAVAHTLRHPWTAETSSPEPLRQRVAQRDRLILGQRQHALAGDVGIQLNGAVALADHHVGEPDAGTVRRAGGVDHPSVRARLLRCLGRLLCCDHPHDNGGKIELVVHTAWTLATDPEAVTQAVQLPHPTLSPPVQCEHQVPGYRVVADDDRR